MFRIEDLDAINSATKYPSIPTFHTMDGRGKLTKEHMAIPDEPLFCTEKLDGTNARIIIDPSDGDYLIGGRNELLCARGDRLGRDSNRILEATLVLASAAANKLAASSQSSGPVVIYGEAYGGRIGRNWSTYTTDSAQVGFRVFDVQTWTAGMWYEWLHMDAETRSLRREQGGQPFVTATHHEMAQLGLKLVPTSPFDLDPNDSHAGIYSQLCAMGTTSQAVITEGVSARAQRPEGVVLRNADRSWIAKFRHADYARSTR
jgi:hypothetical protein